MTGHAKNPAGTSGGRHGALNAAVGHRAGGGAPQGGDGHAGHQSQATDSHSYLASSISQFTRRIIHDRVVKGTSRQGNLLDPPLDPALRSGNDFTLSDGRPLR